MKIRIGDLLCDATPYSTDTFETGVQLRTGEVLLSSDIHRRHVALIEATDAERQWLDAQGLINAFAAHRRLHTGLASWLRARGLDGVWTADGPTRSARDFRDCRRDSLLVYQEAALSMAFDIHNRSGWVPVGEAFGVLNGDALSGLFRLVTDDGESAHAP